MIRKVVKAIIPKRVFRAVEPHGHKAEAVAFNTLKRFPARGLKIIGVTGTNGKTSTCFLIHRMLHEAGYKVGLMTTVGYGVGLDFHPQMTHMTTMSVPALLRRITELKSHGAEWIVLEVTSHALAQSRVWGIPFQIAVMTNVTREHLGYHGTFERYTAAKLKLFEQTNKNKTGLRIGIINADDPAAELFGHSIERNVLYGVDHGHLRAEKISQSPDGVEYEVVRGYDNYHIKCQLPGSFNVYNSLAAVAVGEALGLTSKQIEHGIAALKGVEGRMERIDEGQDFTVMVDYAHSPDSFEKLLGDLRPIVKGKLIVLFGSLGGGDKGKRPLQGKLAGQYADEVIVCEEDDRKEDPETILNDIAEGVEAAGKVRDKDLFIIHDRPEAIKFAIGRAKAGDMVLLLGKGHEKTIEHADGEHPWDEMGEARKAIKARK